MPDPQVPESLPIPFGSLVNLGVEYHRLATWIESAGSTGAAPARHALRRLADFLKACDLEAHSMDGKPFDPGLAVRVIDSYDDPSLPPGQSVIAETLSPLVLWRGRVVKPADVVVKKNQGTVTK
jgi:hypothetical protein